MKLKTKGLSVICLMITTMCFGQMQDYNYTQALNGVSDAWHKVIMPDHIFSSVSNDLSDIRVYGITASKDTIEAPYFIQTVQDKSTSNNVDMKLLNKTFNQDGFFYTFEVSNKASINQIRLDFRQTNYDWTVRLEGSQNQIEWYTIGDDFRIISIDDATMNYAYTKLKFKDSKFQYFRIKIDAKEKPELNFARLSEQNVVKGKYKTAVIRKTSRSENKKTKQTEIDVEFNIPVPICRFNMSAIADLDFYRPIVVKQLLDSIKTAKGWRYNYGTLTSGTISSVGTNEFNFNSTTVQKLKIIINNYDNQPLNGLTFDFEYLVHEMIARFDESADYYLTFGNQKVGLPKYDIVRFKDKIPDSLSVLKLGPVVKSEAKIAQENQTIKNAEPLFQNKNWLWGVMTVMILLLGFFTLYMIRNKKDE